MQPWPKDKTPCCCHCPVDSWKAQRSRALWVKSGRHGKIFTIYKLRSYLQWGDISLYLSAFKKVFYCISQASLHIYIVLSPTHCKRSKNCRYCVSICKKFSILKVLILINKSQVCLNYRFLLFISGIATSYFSQIHRSYPKIRVNPGKSIHDFCVIHFILQIQLLLWYWQDVIWNQHLFSN